MTDLVLSWLSNASMADLVLASGQLLTDEGLESAVLISLFTDRRAEADDTLPQPGADPRGWWGDAIAQDEGDQIGSRLWLLAREKQLSSVVARAKLYAEEALAWLVEDGVAARVVVTAEIVAEGALGLGVEIYRPQGPARFRFDYVWKAA
jgi:phage gp46-like protein